jgi:hypothetical protein
MGRPACRRRRQPDEACRKRLKRSRGPFIARGRLERSATTRHNICAELLALKGTSVGFQGPEAPRDVAVSEVRLNQRILTGLGIRVSCPHELAKEFG